MPSTGSSPITIIGGTYREICFEPYWNKVYGSGFRAVSLFHELDPNKEVSFCSCCESNIATAIKGKFRCSPIRFEFLTEQRPTTTFYYENPFRVSNINPRTDWLFAHKDTIKAEDENILVFGMIDNDFIVKGDKVVYDPQTSVMQSRFSATGSVAKQLVLIMNMSEAVAMSGKKDLLEIRDKLFELENCHALIIKQGATGAVLFRNKTDEGFRIPVYMTDNVFLIGSGDIFTSYFAYCWFNDNSLEEAASLASKAVACYSDCNDLSRIKDNLDSFNYPALEISKDCNKQVYLAGPFFNYSQRWIIYEFYKCLKDNGISVFSPYHDVGIGNADETTEPDLKGLHDSAVLLAIIDGVDPGTVFEVGYAKALQRLVIVYTENEDEKSLQMMKGTNCIFVHSFTEAIYKTCWYALQ